MTTAWCEGNLRIKGDLDNIVKFLKESLVAVNSLGEFNKETIKYIFKDEEFSMKTKTNYSFYLNGTKRNFINNNVIKSGYYEQENNTKCIVLDNFVAAGDIDVDALVDLSDTYGICIKVIAYESITMFTREVEIVYGQLTKDITDLLENYIWDVCDPFKGGII